MAKLNYAHMIEEIRDNAGTGDLMKARLVLSHFGDVDLKTRNRLVYELSRGKAEFSIPLLLFLIDEYPDVLEAMPIIKETLLSNLLAYPEMLLSFLKDPALPDKKELIRIAAELKFDETTPVLIDIAANTTDEAEIHLIIETLGHIGDPEATHTLTEFLYTGKNELGSAAVRSLGMVGTPTAMHRLAERMGADNEIDFLILSVFAEVQDRVSLEKLSETLASHYAHMRSFAKKELVKIGPKAVPFLIANLGRRDSDFLVHTLNVLGDIGDESAVVPIRKLLQNEPKSANVRFAAYEALALLPLRKGAYTLTAGLLDAEEHVCIAAARAIDQNFSNILGAGIKNLLRNMDDEAKHIVKIIIDSQADKVFLSLAEEDFFQELALIYLPLTHKDTLHHYHDLLTGNGFKDFAGKIAGEKIETTRSRVVAVDDSKMILNIYKSTLHQLGFDPILFEFPSAAIEWLQSEKPLLVLTDLNMPDITGVQLTKEIRKIYSGPELPVIMVTTQNDANDNEAAVRAGVDKIIHKPFNAASLQAAMAEYL
ncbi:response regulator [Desulfopila inferna]|uniref:response regulator n=1 Tax=Desulfopila inferna TaxID=468528 RepID=UPI001965C0CF|nr:response regulator [Desulfopila inferna]MBM9604399.1 response regulator [Desulfopila inferna]